MGLIAENGRELRDHFAAQLDLLQLDYRTGRKIEEVDLIGAARGVGEAARPRRHHCDRRLQTQARHSRRRETRVAASASRPPATTASTRAKKSRSSAAATQPCRIVCSLPASALASRSFTARIDIARARIGLNRRGKTPRITFIDNAEVTAIEGGERVERLIIEDTRTGAIKTIETEGVFIRVGVSPNTEMFRGQVEMDEAGFIQTDHRQRTSVEMVYAPGETFAGPRV